MKLVLVAIFILMVNWYPNVLIIFLFPADIYSHNLLPQSMPQIQEVHPQSCALWSFSFTKDKKINVSITQICSLSRNINMLFLCQQMLISWSTTWWCVHIPNKNSNSIYITYGYGCRNCPNLKITQTQCISFTVQTILFDSTFLLPVGLIHILLCKLI